MKNIFYYYFYSIFFIFIKRCIYIWKYGMLNN